MAKKKYQGKLPKGFKLIPGLEDEYLGEDGEVYWWNNKEIEVYGRIFYPGWHCRPSYIRIGDKEYNLQKLREKTWEISEHNW